MEIVLGPPGTGKTTRLLGIVEEELRRGVPPEKIGYVSFTKRAAEEAAARASSKFGFERERLPWFRTLHSLCFRWLGLKRAEVLDGPRLREFSAYAGVRIDGRGIAEDGTTTGFETGDRIMFMENLARARCRPLRQQYDEDNDDLSWSVVKHVADCLVAFKNQTGYLDYSDMLSRYVEEGAALGLRSLIVDEAQDNSMLQWRVVSQLAKGCERVAVAGDDDQAIYKWAGAAVEHFVDLEGDVSVLGASWRVPRAVQEIATEIRSRITRRRPKEWRPRDAAGLVDRAVDIERVDLEGKDVLVLARNVYLLREQIVPWLRSQGIVYERSGRSSLSEGLLDAVQAWERLRKGGAVTGAAARGVYAYVKSGSGVARGFKKLPAVADEDEVTMLALREHGGLVAPDAPWFESLDMIAEHDREYVRAALKRGEKLRGKPRIRVSTIHGSKGGEADHVVLMTEMAKRTHREMEFAPGDEARVWYVAATRARERLTIVEPQTSQFYHV